MCPIWQAVGDSSLKVKVPGALQWLDATGLPESDLTQSPSSAPGKSGCVFPWRSSCTKRMQKSWAWPTYWPPGSESVKELLIWAQDRGHNDKTSHCIIFPFLLHFSFFSRKNKTLSARLRLAALCERKPGKDGYIRCSSLSPPLAHLVTEDLYLAVGPVYWLVAAVVIAVGVNLNVEGQALHALLRREIGA